MITNVTSLTGNGLKDWLIQRVSAVYLAVYSIFLLFFFFKNSPFSFAQWHQLFSNPGFIVATIIGLISLSLHSWIGIWTVTTDYIKCTIVRLSIQLIVALWLIGQFIWALLLLWGQ